MTTPRKVPKPTTPPPPATPPKPMTTPPRTPTTLDAAWEALEIELDGPDHRVMSVIARHRPLIEAEARVAPDPAPLDVERLARAFWSVTRLRFAASPWRHPKPMVPDLPEWRDPSIDAATWDKSVSDAAEVAREYEAQP